jgi:hypothetical protein
MRRPPSADPQELIGVGISIDHAPLLIDQDHRRHESIEQRVIDAQQQLQ